MVRVLADGVGTLDAGPLPLKKLRPTSVRQLPWNEFARCVSGRCNFRAEGRHHQRLVVALRFYEVVYRFHKLIGGHLLNVAQSGAVKGYTNDRHGQWIAHSSGVVPLSTGPSSLTRLIATLLLKMLQASANRGNDRKSRIGTVVWRSSAETGAGPTK